MQFDDKDYNIVTIKITTLSPSLTKQMLFAIMYAGNLYIGKIPVSIHGKERQNMISTDNLCMSCMHEIGSEKKCPYCGYYADSAQITPYLPVRTVIANRYLVGKILEYNGEGATYIGWDITEKKPVKIREFIPDSFTIRTSSELTLQIMKGGEAAFSELRQSFEELWSKLARFKGLNGLIAVNEVVRDYGTSYAIYDHFEGISLRDFLLRSKTGYLPWDKARQILMPVLSTLGTLHNAGIIHRGISPSTLILGTDGKIKISGFCIGAARTARSDLNSQLFDGYSAIEQYGFDGQQGTWTDIYAFTAVLYRTLIGSDPIPAKERVTNDRLMVPGKFAEALPAYVINGLINGLQILPDDRTRTVDQLRAELSASPVATAASGQYQRTGVQPAPSGESGNSAPEEGGKKLPVTLITAAACVLAGLLIFVVLALTVFKDNIHFTIGSNNGGNNAAVTECEPIAVPEFKGRSYVDISSNPVFTSKFTFAEPELVYSDDVAEGYVIDQSVAADTLVQPGTEIKLYVSKGKEVIVLPDVEGTNYEEAEKRLTEIGFEVERHDTSEGSYADGEVIRMAPGADQSYPKGTKVILSVFVSPTTEAQPEEPTYEPDNEDEEDEQDTVNEDNNGSSSEEENE